MTNPRSVLLTVFLLTLFTSSSFAQSIAGKIISEQGQPIGFASVTLLKDSSIIKKTASDNAGAYSIPNVPRDTYILKISFVGYKTVGQTIYINGDTSINIRLFLDTSRLKAVTVTSKKPLIERKIDRLLFNIDGNPNFAGLDAMDALMRAPLLDVRDNAIQRIGGMPMGVMIDGRLLAHLDPAAIANKLRSIPSESILRIEIITNPGAEYDAEGIGGLVNIVLKKNKKLGYNGSVTLAYTRINKDNLFRIGADLNYNVKRLRTFFSFGTSTGRALTANSSSIFYPSITWNSTSYHYEYSKPYFATMGLEYDLSKKSSIGLSFNPLLSFPDQKGASSISVLNPANNQTDSTISNTVTSAITYKNYALNLHYNHALDSTGGQLNVDLDWVKNSFSKDITNNNQTFDPSGVPKPGSAFQYISLNSDRPELVTLNAVVDKPRGKYTLSYGAKVSFIQSSQSINQYKKYLTPSQTDTLNLNQFNADQSIQALFGSYDRTMKKWEFKVGLRAENTQLHWSIPSPSSNGSQNYFKVFPNANLSYEINDKSNVTLSFNRRFSRPSFSSLNPTLIYVSTYRFYRGNSELMPYFSTNIDLSYSYKPNLTLGFSYGSTAHAIYSLPDIKPNSNIVIDNFYNYINTKTYELDCFYSLGKIKNLQSSIQASGYYNEVHSSLPQTPTSLSRISGNIRLGNTYFFNKAKTLVGGLIFNYQLSDLSGTSTTKERYYFDVSLKYSFLKRRMDINLSGRDIFKTNNFYFSNTVNGILEKSFVNDRSRRFGISVRYNFGNNKIRKGSQHNATGADQSIISH